MTIRTVLLTGPDRALASQIMRGIWKAIDVAIVCAPERADSIIHAVTSCRPSIWIVALGSGAEPASLLTAVQNCAPRVPCIAIVKALAPAPQTNGFFDATLTVDALPARLKDLLARRDRPSTTTAAVLTQREQQVLMLLASGYHNKQIAAELKIAEGTVKLHLHRMYEKFDVDSRLLLTLVAQRDGYLPA